MLFSKSSAHMFVLACRTKTVTVPRAPCRSDGLWIRRPSRRNDCDRIRTAIWPSRRPLFASCLCRRVRIRATLVQRRTEKSAVILGYTTSANTRVLVQSTSESDSTNARGAWVAADGGLFGESLKISSTRRWPMRRVSLLRNISGIEDEPEHHGKRFNGIVYRYTALRYSEDKMTVVTARFVRFLLTLLVFFRF